MRLPEQGVSHHLAVRLLGEHQGRLATTDHVLVETWAVARSRRHRAAADELVATILDRNVAEVLTATRQDIVTALRIGETFADQDFSEEGRDRSGEESRTRSRARKLVSTGAKRSWSGRCSAAEVTMAMRASDNGLPKGVNADESNWGTGCWAP